MKPKTDEKFITVQFELQVQPIWWLVFRRALRKVAASLEFGQLLALDGDRVRWLLEAYHLDIKGSVDDTPVIRHVKLRKWIIRMDPIIGPLDLDAAQKSTILAEFSSRVVQNLTSAR